MKQVLETLLVDDSTGVRIQHGIVTSRGDCLPIDGKESMTLGWPQHFLDHSLNSSRDIVTIDQTIFLNHIGIIIELATGNIIHQVLLNVVIAFLNIDTGKGEIEVIGPSELAFQSCNVVSIARIKVGKSIHARTKGLVMARRFIGKNVKDLGQNSIGRCGFGKEIIIRKRRRSV